MHRVNSRLPCIVKQRSKSAKNLRDAVRNFSENAPPEVPAPRKGGAGKFLAYSLGLVTVGTGGTVGYAYLDPSFRKKVEDSVPGSSYVFKSILDDQRQQSSALVAWKSNQKSIQEDIKSFLPKRKTDELTTGDALIPKTPEPISKVPDGKKKDEATKKAIAKEDNDKKSLNDQLERAIQEAIQATEGAVKKAALSASDVIAAIEHHTKLLRHAVEENQEENWSSATKASDAMSFAETKKDEIVAAALGALEELRKTVNDGRSKKLTADNPILTNAAETLNSLNYQLEEAISKVKSAHTESKIWTEFKDMVNQGREQFARELKSVLPNVDINAKGAKLTEDELNALIAHAHLRVDQLKKQLAEQQVKEEKHIQLAVERQKAEDAKLAEEKLERQRKLLEGTFDSASHSQVSKLREEFEAELRAQLRRATAAHSDNLQDVLKTQREQHNIELSQRLQEAVEKERDVYLNEVASSVARLQGIESALDSRAVQDADNRRSKELWLACQNLRESILFGNKSAMNVERRRKALSNEVQVIKDAGSNDPLVNTVISYFADDALNSGVYTDEDLKTRFAKIRKLCRRTAMIGDGGGTLWQYFISTLQSMVTFDVWKKYSSDEEIDPESLDTYQILSRAQFYIFEESDFTTAMKYMMLLKGEPGRIAQDWVRDVRTHLETLQAADLLLAHAAAIGVRTVY